MSRNHSKYDGLHQFACLSERQAMAVLGKAFWNRFFCGFLSLGLAFVDIKGIAISASFEDPGNPQVLQEYARWSYNARVWAL